MEGLLDDDGLLALGKKATDRGQGAPPDTAEGACHICGQRPGRLACRSCGRRACAADTWTMFGLCNACTSDSDMARWHAEGRVDTVNWLDRPPGGA